MQEALRKKGICTLKREQFNKIYNKGLFYSNKHLVIYVIKNLKNSNFYGISISKKVGNSVVRSRLRRLIKESIRLSQHDIQKGYNVIIVSRTKEDANFNFIDNSLKKLFVKAKMMKI